MGDGQTLLAMFVFFGVVISLSIMGMDTGIQYNEFGSSDINDSYDSDSWSDNALIMLDYVKNFSSNYTIITYVVIIPTLLFILYVIVDIVWVG